MDVGPNPVGLMRMLNCFFRVIRLISEISIEKTQGPTAISFPKLISNKVISKKIITKRFISNRVLSNKVVTKRFVTSRVVDAVARC